MTSLTLPVRTVYYRFHEPCKLETVNGERQVQAYRVRSVVLLLHALSLVAARSDRDRPEWFHAHGVQICSLNFCVTVLSLPSPLWKVHESCSS